MYIKHPSDRIALAWHRTVYLSAAARAARRRRGAPRRWATRAECPLSVFIPADVQPYSHDTYMYISSLLTHRMSVGNGHADGWRRWSMRA